MTDKRKVPPRDGRHSYASRHRRHRGRFVARPLRRPVSESGDPSATRPVDIDTPGGSPKVQCR
jgi:hypothetical protein